MGSYKDKEKLHQETYDGILSRLHYDPVETADTLSKQLKQKAVKHIL